MVGFFDSGLGGLSIWQTVVLARPGMATLYVADQAAAPYGNKAEAFIRQRSLLVVQYLISQGVSTVVVACNTATVNTPIKMLRANFPQITFVGVEPPVKLLSWLTEEESLLCVTPATFNSKRLRELSLNYSQGQIRVLSTPEWAELVEQGIPEEYTKTVVRKYLEPFVSSSVKLIGLGCTHYYFLVPLLRKLYRSRFEFVTVNQAVTDQVLKKAHIENQTPSHSFVTTGNAVLFKQALFNLLRLNSSVESVNI